MQAFYIVAFGQLISIVGTSMTQFALTIWSWDFVTRIQPVEDPATAVALIAVFNFAPQVLFSPIAGALVDRWKRKTAMIVVDLAAGLATIAVLLLYSSGTLQIWHLYIAGAWAGVFYSFHFPAYSAAISVMVPKDQYMRADAILGLTESLSGIFAPLLAGILIGVVGIAGVMVIDILTFSAAIGALLFILIPEPERREAAHVGWRGLLADSIFGFRYIFRRPSLFGLQMVFFFGNLLAGPLIVLYGPLILSRTGSDELALGSVQSALGLGAVVGGLALAARGGFKRRIHGVLLGWILTSVFGPVLLGAGRSLPLWMAAGFLSALTTVLLNSSNQAIWQAKTPPAIQGRVFAARRMIAQIVGPLGMVLAGPLADRVFEPAMREGGALADSLGWLVGIGAGAGMALLLVLTGLLTAVVGAVAYLVPAIRNVEDIMPDHDAQPAEAESGAAEAPATAG